MGSRRGKKWLPLLLITAVLVMGADGTGPAPDERAALLEQQRALQAKVEALRREEDFLLFQKAMYSSDSKYLIINVKARTGWFKYKNRVLKDFRFAPTSRNLAAALQPGVVVLTNKVDGGKGRTELIFGEALVLRGEKAVASSSKKIPFLLLNKKDLASIAFSLERGAMAYIVR